MPAFLRICLVLAAGILFVVSNAQKLCAEDLQAKENLKSRIDALVLPYLDSGTVMGMTVGILQKGETTTLGYGHLSAGHLSDKDHRQPDGDTLYEIGSISKVFTGILLAKAVTQGSVQLDQPAGELLPSNVKMPVHGKRPITLQDLSTHVSGLPRLPDSFTPADWSNPYADFTVENLYGFLNHCELSRDPGVKIAYSNLGVGLLGHLLSLQKKSSYEQLLHDHLTKPLQMNDTLITFTKRSLTRLAAPHDGDGRRVANWDLPTLAGAGAIRSTANDMLLLAKANLDPPKNELGKAIELAWKVHQKPIAAGNFAMGLGWHVAHDGSTRWHNGQTGGYHSMLLVNRDANTAVVLLANTATGEVDLLAQDIFRALAGKKVKPRTFDKSIPVDSQVMRRYIGKYELAPEVVFTVTVKNKKLMVGLTGQQMLQVYARSETEWFYKAVKATLTFQSNKEAFQSNKEGVCNSLEIFQHGVRQKAHRVE